MQLFRTPHPCKRSSGSMGNGSIANSMTAAPRQLRKSFGVPILQPLPGGKIPVPGSGVPIDITPSRLITPAD